MSPLADAAAQSPLRGARPLFVLGAPRSGTTLLARLLDAHPQVLMTNEVRVFTFFQHAFRDLPRGDAGGLQCSREYGDEFAGALEEHAAAVVHRTYERIALRRGETDLRYWGDKNPHHAESLELIDRCFPAALFIRIRRDPRDVVCSILEMRESSRASAVTSRFAALRWLEPLLLRRRFQIGTGAAATARVAAAARGVAASIRKSRAFLSALPAERVLELAYEDLVRSPAGSLDDLFVRFLGLPDAELPRRWLLENRSRDSHARIEGRVDFERRSLGRFLHELNPEEIAAAEHELGEVLAAEGYAGQA